MVALWSVGGAPDAAMVSRVEQAIAETEAVSNRRRKFTCFEPWELDQVWE